jgi:FkbM family methyltransferase
VNDLMSLKRVSSFERVLSAYGKVNGGNRFDAIDGGAGSGSTARQMLKHIGPQQKVHAFEPFPGNHRFFKPDETRIVLHPHAMAAAPCEMTFRVPSVVKEDSEWGRGGMAGYSSVGYLAKGPAKAGQDLTVQCVAADTEVGDVSSIGFVKLDLQGGELDALKGMQKLLPTVRFMWVEFTCQPGLMEFLGDHHFSIYDTQYLMMGEPLPEALRLFDVSDPRVPLSTGVNAWYGFRRTSWRNYEADFKAAQRDFGLIQTDLVCINTRYLDEFIDSLKYL